MLPGDGCGWSLQCGRWATSSPPQPLPIPSAALQHSSGPTGCPADPGRPLFTWLDIHSSLHWFYVKEFLIPPISPHPPPRPWRRTFRSAMWSHLSPIRRGARGCCSTYSFPLCSLLALEAKVRAYSLHPLFYFVLCALLLFLSCYSTINLGYLKDAIFIEAIFFIVIFGIVLILWHMVYCVNCNKLLITT